MVGHYCFASSGSVSETTFAYWIKNMNEPVPLTLANIGMLTWLGNSARFGTISQQRGTVASTHSYAQCVHVPSECGSLLQLWIFIIHSTCGFWSKSWVGNAVWVAHEPPCFYWTWPWWNCLTLTNKLETPHNAFGVFAGQLFSNQLWWERKSGAPNCAPT